MTVQNIFSCGDKMGDRLTIDAFEVQQRSLVMARIFNEDGDLEGSCELRPQALVELALALREHLPALIGDR